MKPSRIEFGTSGLNTETRSWGRRLPWLWVDLVVSRVALPPWVLSVLLFAALAVIGLLVGLLGGEPLRFLLDIRRLALFGLASFASFTIVYARQAMTALQRAMTPWVASSDETTREFWENGPDWLTRGFGLFAAFWAAIPVLYFVIEPLMLHRLPSPGRFAVTRYLIVAMTPLIAYFMGGACCIATVGLGRLVHHMSKVLDLKEGFILQGAKSALAPFNRLVWVTWSTVTLPLMLIALSVVTLGQISGRTIPLRTVDIIPLILLGLVFVSTIIVPQWFMNQFLKREKGEALDDIGRQLAEAVTLPEKAPAEEVLRRMHRLQALTYLEHKIEAFKPTMVDARFVIQFVASLTTVVSFFAAARAYIHYLLP